MSRTRVEREQAAALAAELRRLIGRERDRIEALGLALVELERLEAAHPESCDAEGPKSPCEGLVSARYCGGCGRVWRRCAAHGGLRRAVFDLDTHRGGCAGLPATTREEG